MFSYSLQWRVQPMRRRSWIWSRRALRSDQVSSGWLGVVSFCFLCSVSDGEEDGRVHREFAAYGSDAVREDDVYSTDYSRWDCSPRCVLPRRARPPSVPWCKLSVRTLLPPRFHKKWWSNLGFVCEFSIWEWGISDQFSYFLGSDWLYSILLKAKDPVFLLW